jgi:hypothetical protein
MTSERFLYVLPLPFGPEAFFGPVWPAPVEIAADGTVYQRVTASILTEENMRLLRRVGRGPSHRAAHYVARGAAPALVCGHTLAFDGRCTTCAPIECDRCVDPAHLGSCTECPCTTLATEWRPRS